MVCEEYGNKPSAERKRSIHSVIDYQPDEFLKQSADQQKMN